MTLTGNNSSNHIINNTKTNNQQIEEKNSRLNPNTKIKDLFNFAKFFNNYFKNFLKIFSNLLFYIKQQALKVLTFRMIDINGVIGRLSKS